MVNDCLPWELGMLSSAQVRRDRFAHRSAERESCTGGVVPEVSVYDIPLRVTFYVRVSSDSDNQLNSLDNQVSYYRELVDTGGYSGRAV